MKKIVKSEKTIPKKNVKLVPKHLPLARSEGEIFVDAVFFYVAIAVVAVSLTLLAISLFAL